MGYTLEIIPFYWTRKFTQVSLKAAGLLDVSASSMSPRVPVHFLLAFATGLYASLDYVEKTQP